MSLFVCAAFCVSPAFSAVDDNFTQLFSDGIAAFRDNDFLRARDAFLAAKSAGLDTARLHYNLGVTDYKLGYYPSAYESFEKAAADPAIAALAAYNLGLASLKLNKKDLALKWFLAAQALALDPQLQRLNNYMLVKLRDDMEYQRRAPASHRSNPNVTRTASLNQNDAGPSMAVRGVIKSDFGYDDNVVLYRDSASSSATDVSDMFVALQAVIQANVTPQVNVSFSGYRLDYAEKNNYDFTKFGLETGYHATMAAWRTRFSAGIEQYSLAGKAYQQVSLIKAYARHPITAHSMLLLDLRADFISALDDAYAHLAGRRNTMAATWQWRANHSIVDLSYNYETNSRNDYYYDGVFYASYSPARHAVRASASHNLGRRIVIQLFTATIYSLYKDPDLIAPDHAVSRRDEMYKVGVTLSAQVNQRLRVEGDYFYANNRSIFTKDRYQNNRYILGFRWDY